MSAGRSLFRGALGVGALQVASIGLSFLTAVVLARVLGEEGFGAYSWAATWALVLLGPATLGVGPILTRETAAGLETGAFGRVRAVSGFARKVSALATVAVIGVGAVAVLVARPWVDPVARGPLAWTLPVLGVGAALLVARHRLIGLRRVVEAQLAESVLRPAALLALVAAVWAAGGPLDATGATAAHGLAGLVALGFLVWRIRRATPAEVGAAAPDPDATWLRAALPLLLTGIARDLNAEAGLLLVGSLATPEEAGLFRAASRLASLPTYVLTALNLAFQPLAAGLFARGDLAGIEQLGVRASRVAVLLALPIAVACWAFGRPLLSLFGPGFAEAAPALWILAAGHLFNVACGSVGVILVACKREDDAARGLLISCAVTLAANAVAIPAYGLMGAAVASAIGLVVWNVALSWFTWQRLGILPAAFSWRRRAW